ncbi:MAG: YfjI family protein [Ferrimicrobium sp.]
MTLIKKVGPPKGEPTKNPRPKRSSNNIVVDDVARYLDEMVTSDGLVDNWERVRDPKPKPWPEIDPLDQPPPLPLFPVDALPENVRGYVHEVSEQFQTPIDLAAVYSLAILATAAQGGQVEVQPGWKETLNLYVLMVALTGERKSPVVSALRRPIDELERALRKELATAIAAATSDRVIAKAHLANIEAQLAKTHLKGSERLDFEAERDTTLQQLAEYETQPAPATPLLTLDSITAESLATYLSQHRGILAVLSAEGGLFGDLAGRYSVQAAIDIVLHGFSGESYKSHRKGCPAEEIENVRLTIGLAVQPIVLQQALSNAEFVHRGLIARFLIATPAPPTEVGALHPTPVSKVTEAKYASLIERLVRQNFTTPPALTVDPRAYEILDSVRIALKERVLPGGEYFDDPMRGWASKAAGQIARIAGLIHMARADDPNDTLVTLEDMSNAIEIGRYFVAHAARLFLAPETTPATADQLAILAWAKHKHLAAFTPRDLMRSNSRRFNNADHVKAMLRALAARNYVRSTDSTHFAVNPKIT